MYITPSCFLSMLVYSLISPSITHSQTFRMCDINLMSLVVAILNVSRNNILSCPFLTLCLPLLPITSRPPLQCHLVPSPSLFPSPFHVIIPNSVIFLPIVIIKPSLGQSSGFVTSLCCSLFSLFSVSSSSSWLLSLPPCLPVDSCLSSCFHLLAAILAPPCLRGIWIGTHPVPVSR